jgi:predicted nucleic acid-binding protein
MDILADTNILVRRIRRSDPQSRQTRDAVNRLKSDGHRICVTSQNLIELWAVCTRPVESNGLGLTPAYAERVLARIERSVVRLQDSDSV